MKNLLRKLLGIQTWQIALFNPYYIDPKDISEATRGMPVRLMVNRNVKSETIVFIDTHIVAIKRGGETNGRSKTDSTGSQDTA